MTFDRVIVLDWSASSIPKTGPDSIWIGTADKTGETTENPATRDQALQSLLRHCNAALASGERLLIGADFSFGYPLGFAKALTGQDNALALWDHFSACITDAASNANNRFEIASQINAVLPGIGPFWGCPPKQATAHLPQKGLTTKGHGFAPKRQVESAAKGAQSPWKLFTTGSVGSQSLLGIPRLNALRHQFGAAVSVWPFERHDTPIVLAEVFPTLINSAVNANAHLYSCRDEAQVALLSRCLLRCDQSNRLHHLLTPDVPAQILSGEGWILGAGQAETLLAALSDLTPPRLRNDCFAMPQGVDWIPVKTALTRLKSALIPISRPVNLPLSKALGRVLAQDTIAQRSNPPMPNSAVDGYGFAHSSLGTTPHRLPLASGRAAAGQPFKGVLPPGHAIRILTGAILPEGVDTVVLEEDCTTDMAVVAFDGPIKPRSNTRRAGEDIAEGAIALSKGHRLRAPDLGLLSAIGLSSVTVREKLRVGVLSTGDEVVTKKAAPHQIYDANRPMLLAMAQGWGGEAVDLGHIRDDSSLIRRAFDRAAKKVDIIVTSGGASAGDEDHVSRLLRDAGTLSSWRIAMKPGRPLALAMWQGTPVFGLPGNPVAAMVCALIFLRPAVAALSGEGWTDPIAITLPAAFTKRKKAGRREYLRARINADGCAEVFASEGSGRISGLSWATGLVELPDDAMEVGPGDPVRFLPYSGFGI